MACRLRRERTRSTGSAWPVHGGRGGSQGGRGDFILGIHIKVDFEISLILSLVFSLSSFKI